MGKWITAIIIVILIAIGVVVGVSYNSNTHNNQTSSSTNQNNSNANQNVPGGTVNIRDMMFTPSQITVQKGGTVTWTNNDSVAHTVVDDLSDVGGPNSGDIAPGQAYSFTFTKTGSFQYHDRLHTSMRGTIVVK